ncbi:MAG: hypothetical protein KDG52_14680 [Rhodocyclaceae bacterium]|nr:hypothetical protein [Rhodocyclaceae bacterium]
MKLTIGNPVTGDDFFDRELEQRQIWRKLETNHLLMLAPRRIGKTSLIYRLCETSREHGFQSIKCSFAGCRDERDCVGEIFKAAEPLHTAGQNFAQSLSWLKSIKIAGTTIDWGKDEADCWRAVGEEIGRALADCEHDCLICIDELPVFIVKLLQQGDAGRERARTFLYWLRELRQTHFQRIKWLLAGSIGLDTMTARLRIGDAINDLEPFKLDAFSPDSARRMLAQLAQGYQLPLDAATTEHLLDRVGWPVPYYLQLMFSHLRDGHEDHGVVPSPAAVDGVFDKLLGHGYRVHFDYWRQRLDDELGQPDAGHAARVLDHICPSRQGARVETLSQALLARIPDPDMRERTLNSLLQILENDGYLTRDADGRYAFRLEWLRMYWRQERRP